MIRYYRYAITVSRASPFDGKAEKENVHELLTELWKHYSFCIRVSVV